MKKKVYTLLFSFIFAITIVFLIKPEKKIIDEKPQNPNEQISKEENSKEIDYQEKYAYEIALFKRNKNINSDYVGELYFDSNLINVSIVQGETNDTYLRTDWETMKYRSGGSVFVDYSNDIQNDQNIIIYGHDVASSKDPQHLTYFSPLRYLTSQNNYEGNKYLNLFLQNEIRRYEIAYVFRVNVEVINGSHYIAEGEPVYTKRFYDEVSMNSYLLKVNKNSYYQTGVSLTSSDKFLTLQTCIENSVDKLVIIAKEIERIEF